MISGLLHLSIIRTWFATTAGVQLRLGSDMRALTDSYVRHRNTTTSTELPEKLAGRSASISLPKDERKEILLRSICSRAHTLSQVVDRIRKKNAAAQRSTGFIGDKV